MPPLLASRLLSAACEAIGWAVLYSLPFGLVTAAALVAVLLLTRSPRARYVVSSVLLLALGVAFAVSVCRFWPPIAPQQTMPYVSPELPFWTDLARAGLNTPRLSSLSGTVPMLAPIWFVGALFCYLRLFAGGLWCARARRTAQCASSEWADVVARLAVQWKISRPVKLFESALVDSPAVLGHWRPCILVPAAAFLQLSPEQLELMLMHELAHIRRSDFLLNACLRSVEALLFYHPAAWWMGRVIRAEREYCCDDDVAAHIRNPRGYAEALAALERRRLNDNRPAHSVAMAAKGGQLMRRIERLLYPKGVCLRTQTLGSLLLATVAAATLAAWPLPQESTHGPQAWERWLNEDVVYIITDEERASFTRQTSDEARQHFVQQFWAGRNREEHYRRLTWANAHYQTASGIPGWRTDRGHMYIVYGPPDEIEVHKSSGAKYASEAWMYHQVEGSGANGIFTFVDHTGMRDFRLAPTSLH